MSTSEPPEVPDESSAVPVGPEPAPTGATGPGGSGGWGEQPRTEPFAVAALLWAIVSIVIPIIGTLIAFVLAARAADLIRRARGARSGSRYVTAARIVAGAVLACWAIGLVLFFAFRGGNGTNKNEVAVPTQPPLSTTLAPTTSTSPRTTTTTKPKSTTTPPKPTISVVTPPPTAAPPTAAPTTAASPTVAPSTAAPTVAPSTAAPTTGVPTTAPPTTRPPTTTTNPNAAKAAALQRRLLTRRELGPSNRGVPDDQRFVVSYTPGKNLLITWAIDNGTGPKPTGTPNCTGPPTTPPPTSTSTSTSTTTTTTTTTVPTSTTLPATRTTQEEARYEARQILLRVRNQLAPLKLNTTGLQLVGTYPIDTHGESDVVQVLYSNATVRSAFADYTKAFTVPPAELVQCLNPAFK
jgi:hypothetical protein